MSGERHLTAMPRAAKNGPARGDPARPRDRQTLEQSDNSTVPAATPTEPQATFEELLTPMLDPAYGLAMTLTGNRADAEDLVQEAALAALRGFNTFQPGSNFKAWFYRVLTNCFYGKHRQQKRRPQTVDLDDVPDMYMYARTIESGLHRHTPNPAATVMEQISIEQIQRAIDALPDEYRAVAALYFNEEYTYEEIAAKGAMGDCQRRRHRHQSHHAKGEDPMSGLTRITCEEAFRRLDDYIDRALSPREVQLVEQHLETCAQCWKEYDFETTLVRSIKDKVQKLHIPGELHATILERLALSAERS